MEKKEARSVTLFVPGLTQFDTRQLGDMFSERQSLAALELIYSRAQYHRGSTETVEQTIFDLFALPKEDSKEIPVGALTHYLAKGNDKAGRWMMRADPVMIQPNRDHLVLLGNAAIEISQQDCEQIVSDINDTYGDTEWQIRVVSSTQWVIEQEKAEDITTHGLSHVVGKNINDFLPQGEDSKKWHALMNELQMFLHAHPVNQQRQTQGLPPLNSLWFWGAGVLPAATSIKNDKPFAQCWSEETLSLALARMTGVPRADLPVDGEAWLKQAITPGKHLLVINLLDNDYVKSDPVEWWQALGVLNEHWLTPLVSALKTKQIERLTLISSDGARYQLTRKLANRWWKFIKQI
jgi:hypothetical protein